MKTFYTVRDIEDMHAAGVTEIETHDDVVLTDVAREKAIALGMRLMAANAENGPFRNSGSSAAASPASPAPTGGGPVPPRSASLPNPPAPAGVGGADADTVRKIKTAVIARLGTDKYNDLLDRIIPHVMSQLKK